MTKRKVCYIISNLNLGGAEFSMYKLLCVLNKDLDFIVISLSQGGVLTKDIEEIGIKIFNLDFNNFFWNSLLRLYNILKMEKPNVVHTWMYHSDLIGGLLAKICNVKNIFWGIRNTDLFKGTTLSTRLIGFVNAGFSYIIPNKILVVSNSALIKHSKLYYCKNKMIVIPNGFSFPDKIYSIQEKVLFRSQLGFNQSSLLIGSVGRFNEYKDHQTFIYAALILLDLVGNSQDVNFMLIGKNVKNVFLLNLIQDSQYFNRFHFFDETKSIDKFYSIFDIFCLHSISEGFPNVLAEAMHMGCLCVSTDVGDSKIILNNDQLLVPPKSPYLLAQKLYETINLNQIDRDRFKLNNVQRISDFYSLQSMKENYLKIYNENL